MKLSLDVSGAGRARWVIASVAALGLLVALPGTAQAATAPVPLGTADSFVVLAGSEITNTGTSVVTGDIGVHPGTSLTGMPPLVLTGSDHVADAVALAAKADVSIAYDNAAGRTPFTVLADDLVGATLSPGVYRAGNFTNSGTVTLDAGNDPSAVFVFQSSGTLITASGSHVNLINGASACNVFWQVASSATLGSGSDLSGTVLAQTMITVDDGATVTGRLFAQTAAVTLISNTITQPSCTATPAPTSQVAAVPAGPVSAGDGSTVARTSTAGYAALGALVVAGLGGAAVVAVRRRRLDA